MNPGQVTGWISNSAFHKHPLFERIRLPKGCDLAKYHPRGQHPYHIVLNALQKNKKDWDFSCKIYLGHAQSIWSIVQKMAASPPRPRFDMIFSSFIMPSAARISPFKKCGFNGKLFIKSYTKSLQWIWYFKITWMKNSR